MILFRILFYLNSEAVYDLLSVVILTSSPRDATYCLLKLLDNANLLHCKLLIGYNATNWQ